MAVKNRTLTTDSIAQFESPPLLSDNKNISVCDGANLQKFKPEIRWLDLAAITFVHAGGLYGLYLAATVGTLYTWIGLFGGIYTTGFGITAGVHRLWSHRAYKAAWQLRLVLMLLFTMTGQRDIYTWALDHRVHHKFSETDADPHDARRGFFFAHVAWLFLTPHPEVVRRRKQVDMNDLEADGIVMWQKKYYTLLFAILTIGVPVAIPYLLWNENLWVSFWVHFLTRFAITLNIAFFVNSVAHMWGNRPYDELISPSENLGVSLAALGEGYHNYHHVFPYDYKTGELGDYTFNLTTGFIDFFASIGWATDRKSISQELVDKRKERTGDGTNAHYVLWGWGDKDMRDDERALLCKDVNSNRLKENKTDVHR